MAKKYYAVWAGRKTGIFDSWEDCKDQIEHFKKAGYKSFTSIKQAEEAFHIHSPEPIQYHFPHDALQNTFTSHNGPVPESIAVDASCLGNPGILEYRGVDVKNRKVIFSRGPFKEGTNNIGEFLAIVEAIRYLEKKGIEMPVYSDSLVAIKWVKNKVCNTQLSRHNSEELYLLIESALDYLKTVTHPVRLLKWHTKSWGDIPADYDRK
ncbi:MAG: ribonuclease H family protein [Spirochaetales bacterium]|nr:ribonuclease H family protein [Spirochaetales bacterium]